MAVYAGFLRKVQELFADALVDASENFRNAETQKNTTNGGDVKMYIRESFYSEVDAWDGKSDKTFTIGRTSNVLQSLGVKDNEVIWHSKKMARIMREHSGMTKDVIKQVPQILENPVIILDSKQSDSRLVIFGTVTDAKGIPVTVILELQPTNKGGRILNMNVIASAYGKGNTKNLVESSGLVYIDPDKKRTKSWMQGLGLQLPSDTTALGSIGRITYLEGKVKIKSVPYSQYMRNNSSTEINSDRLSAKTQADAFEQFHRAMNSVVNPGAKAMDGNEILTDGAVVTDGNGKMYSLRSMKHDIAEGKMDVLYAINAKKEELAATKSPRFTATPLSVTSSTISIAELLDLVNQYFPDVLPEDVLKHYGHSTRPEGSLSGEVLYQDRQTAPTTNRTILANALVALYGTTAFTQKPCTG